MKTYTKLLEEIEKLNVKFINYPSYYGLLRRLEQESYDFKTRIERLEKIIEGQCCGKCK